ncbi:MAG: hypothetical protein ACI83O_000412 [Patescibacteria group bacterium]|jgi:hypothetical protein
MLVVSPVLALGVTPARTTIDFEPNYKAQGSFKVIRSVDGEQTLTLTKQGELANSIQLSTSTIEFSEGQLEQRITYDIQLPFNLAPGLHIGEIAISEGNSGGANQASAVGGTLTVITQIYVYVPFPGKYIAADIEVNQQSQSQNIQFVVPVISIGQVELDQVYATIEIYNSNNRKIETLTTNTFSISSGAKADLVSNWETQVNSGEYTAKATVIFDEEAVNVEETFTIEGQGFVSNNFGIDQMLLYILLGIIIALIIGFIYFWAKRR